MTLTGDGRIGFKWAHSFGWQPYTMTDEEWRDRRDRFGVGIKTNGIGKHYTGHLFLSEPREPSPYAGHER